MKKLLILVSLMLIASGIAFATQDAANFPGIDCSPGNSGKHKRYWCHYPQANFNNPQLLCVDVASIDDADGAGSGGLSRRSDGATAHRRPIVWRNRADPLAASCVRSRATTIGKSKGLVT